MNTATQEDVRPPISVVGAEGEVARRLGVDVAVDLSKTEPASRWQSNGPNKPSAGTDGYGFPAFVRQCEDFMQIGLPLAAAVNLVVDGEADRLDSRHTAIS